MMPTGYKVVNPYQDKWLEQSQATQTLYKLAEHALWPDTSAFALDEQPPVFNAEVEIETLYESIRSSDVARRLWPKFAALSAPAVVIVEPLSMEADEMRNGARTDMTRRTVFFTRNGFALSLEAVLHELAHVVVRDEFGLLASVMGEVLGHGVEFARVYVKLLESFLDPAVARRLESTLENGSPLYKDIRS